MLSHYFCIPLLKPFHTSLFFLVLFCFILVWFAVSLVLVVWFGFFGWFAFVFFSFLLLLFAYLVGFLILFVVLTMRVFMLYLFLLWLSGWTDPSGKKFLKFSQYSLPCLLFMIPRGHSLKKFCHLEFQVFSSLIFLMVFQILKPWSHCQCNQDCH